MCSSCSSMSKRHLKDQSMSLCACCSFPRNYATCMPLPRLKVTQVAALRGFVRGTLLLSRPPGLDTCASSLLVTTVSRGHCWVSLLQQWLDHIATVTLDTVVAFAIVVFVMCIVALLLSRPVLCEEHLWNLCAPESIHLSSFLVYFQNIISHLRVECCPHSYMMAVLPI